MSIGLIKQNIKTDLAAVGAGNSLDLHALAKTDNNYKLRPLKIMVAKSSDAIVAVELALQGEVESQSFIYQLKTNVEYDLAARYVLFDGTAALEDILIIGEPI